MTNFQKLAGRVEALATQWPALTHTFMFVAGALFALIQAERGGVRNRRSYEEQERSGHVVLLREMTQSIQSLNEPPDGWVAGLMYNSAIMRLDACYERFLEAIAAEMKNKGRLAAASSTPGLSDTERRALQLETSLAVQEPFVRTRLELNRKDVNRLKHRLFGREAADERSRTIGDVENATGALDELLTILERPEVQSSLATAYKDLPPA